MPIDREQYARVLEKIAEEIDIPPSKYRDAVNRFQSVGRWLEAGAYQEAVGEPIIYSQGSFRLGTVVRPIRGGLETDYDIDLVCELPIAIQRTNAFSVKAMIGDRLREHGTYRRLLDDEGKRCWTLIYAEQDDIGFHLDILPSIPHRFDHIETSIEITNKKGNVYTWSASDPRGYAAWFERQNQNAFKLVQMQQKRSIQARDSTVYASIEDVPDQLVRTPLQRSVQIMKRHRDCRFDSRESNGHAPISIIITTLAAQLYQGEPDVYSALSGIVSKLHAYAALVDYKPVPLSAAASHLIARRGDGKWHILNPVNPAENFADRWHEDNDARARAFFWWVEALKQDLVDILGESHLEKARNRLSAVLAVSNTSRHVGLIASTQAAVLSPPRVRISKPARPWGPE